MSAASLKLKNKFKNEYLSVSRIKLFEKCPLSFAYSYALKRDRQFGEAAEFGKLLHAALENIYNWVCDEEFSGKMTDEVIIKQYVRAFEQSLVTGTQNYKDGLQMVRDYFRIHRYVQDTRVLAVEKKFVIELHGYTVLGYIDRIDRVDSDTVLIIDYKTNRMMFSKDDLDNDLQVSIYGIAVKKLYPWVKYVQFGFDMLRHNVRQPTRRTDEQLRNAADYMAAMAARIESSDVFEAKLNVLCAWCDHREECQEYQDALTKGEQSLSYMVAKSDLAAVCKERERAATLSKIADMRKKEMDKIIMGVLRTQGEFVQDGTKFRSSQKSFKEYDNDKLLDELKNGLSIPRGTIANKIMVPFQKKINALLDASNLTGGKKQLLQAKIEATGTLVHQSPFVTARKVTERKGKKK